MYIVCVLKIWKMKLTFLKRNHCGTLSARASNGSDGDSVSPDLGSSCYQLRLSTDNKSCL